LPIDDLHFDRLRRRFVLGGFAAALGLGAARRPDVASAKKRRKTKPKRNAFGCVDVGGLCKHAGQCCWAICRGKQGKKTCKSHDAGVGCQAGQHEGSCGGTNLPCTTSTGFGGLCDTTTGNAASCVQGFHCMNWRQDADCQGGVRTRRCLHPMPRLRRPGHGRHRLCRSQPHGLREPQLGRVRKPATDRSACGHAPNRPSGMARPPAEPLAFGALTCLGVGAAWVVYAWIE
jgi:hypothetical protein